MDMHEAKLYAIKFSPLRISIPAYCQQLRSKGFSNKDINQVKGTIIHGLEKIRVSTNRKPEYKIEYHTRKFKRKHGLLRASRILRGKHTLEEWEAKKQQYNYRCFYCHRKLKRLTKDHVVSVSSGGSNAITNIVPACRNCNSRKHVKDVCDFKNGATFKML